MAKSDFVPYDYDERFRDVVGQEWPDANLVNHGTSEIPETWDSGIAPGDEWAYGTGASTWNRYQHPNVYGNYCFDTPLVSSGYTSVDDHLPGCYYRKIDENYAGPWSFSNGTWGYANQHKPDYEFDAGPASQVYTPVRAQGWPLDWFTLTDWSRPETLQETRSQFAGSR